MDSRTTRYEWDCHTTYDRLTIREVRRLFSYVDSPTRIGTLGLTASFEKNGMPLRFNRPLKYKRGESFGISTVQRQNYPACMGYRTPDALHWKPIWRNMAAHFSNLSVGPICKQAQERIKRRKTHGSSTVVTARLGRGRQSCTCWWSEELL